MRIAAAQAISEAGAVPANVLIHMQFITAAQAAGGGRLLFPELSLGGYKLPRLAGCLVRPGDAGLAPLREAVRANGMPLVVGAPVTGTGASQRAVPSASCPMASTRFTASGTCTPVKKSSRPAAPGTGNVLVIAS